MTDPADRLDDLASAHLDGATTAEEEAQIAADPELQRRVAAMRAVRAAVQAPIEVDPRAREAAIASALASFDQLQTTTAPRDELVERRAARSRPLRILGAAAAIVALALLVPVLSRIGSQHQQDQTASAGSTTLSSEAASPGGVTAPADPAADAAGGTGDVTSTTGGASGSEVDHRDLGAYPNLEALVQAVRSGDAFTRSSVTPTSAGPKEAASPTCPPDAPGALVSQGSATVDRRTLVVIVRASGGRSTVTIYDPQRSCAVVRSEAL